jgi:hypothetical protein
MLVDFFLLLTLAASRHLSVVRITPHRGVKTLHLGVRLRQRIR